MKKQQLMISVLAGLIVGQIFAEGERPFTLTNTLRIGYDDNLNRNRSDQSTTTYMEDMVQLAFRAALSERTDLLFRSKFTFHTDSDRQKLDPNIYVILSHSVSPRLLVQISEAYLSGFRTVNADGERYDYFQNTLTATPSYVLSDKDRLSLPLSYTIKQHENEIDALDYEIMSAGLSWKRDLIPQRTWAALNVTQTAVDYPNRDSDFDSTRLTTELSHTFNPQWRGSVEAGVSFDKTSYPGGGSDAQNPYFSTTLAYEPSPRTRLSGEFTHQYSESENSSYAGQKSSEILLSAQHDFTARIMGKVSARFVDSQYDRTDSEIGSGGRDEKRKDLFASVQYKINRINFLELRVRHSTKDYGGDQGDWNQNRVDLGWRVEL